MCRQGAERRVQQIDVDEFRRVNASLFKQRPPDGALFPSRYWTPGQRTCNGLGKCLEAPLSTLSDSSTRLQAVGCSKLLVDFVPIEHPIVVVFGMRNCSDSRRCREAPKFSFHQLTLGKPCSAILAPATGRVDADHLCPAARLNDFRSVGGRMRGMVNTVLNNDSVKSLSLTADVDPGNCDLSFR